MATRTEAPARPRRWNRSLRALVLATVAMSLLYWGAFGWMVYRAPMAYEAIDLDHDGSVSFDEADYASSFGMRTIYREGEQCIEYYAEKDGHALKLVCPQ